MQMIIANRLLDGRVVFMDDSGGWVNDIADGSLLVSQQDAAEQLNAAEQAVEENMVVDPYLIDVSADSGRRRPVQVRERIRAFGPSVGLVPQGHGGA
ncbi:MAG: DUF2849 domain-containing protein [Rhodospirillaceae bacterium]|nr:DUF2849 domain-containing protein [Rhodospirillaceae bacterium]